VYVWVCGGRGVRVGVRRQGCTYGCAEAGVYVWLCGGRGVRMGVQRQESDAYGGVYSDTCMYPPPHTTHAVVSSPRTLNPKT